MMRACVLRYPDRMALFADSGRSGPVCERQFSGAFPPYLSELYVGENRRPEEPVTDTRVRVGCLLRRLVYFCLRNR